MSTIRNNLDQAKAEYFAARYPGDLASEVLTLRLTPSSVEAARGPREMKPMGMGSAADAAVARRRFGSTLWIGGGISTAVAAGFVAAILLRPAQFPDRAVYPVNETRGDSNPGIVFMPRGDIRIGNVPVMPGVPVNSGFELVRQQQQPGGTNFVNGVQGQRPAFPNMSEGMFLQPDTVLPGAQAKPAQRP